jgi:hypothetical protein
LASRSPTAQIVVAIVVPALFGLICGIVLGVSGALYGVLAVLATFGGIGAGFEHDDVGEGAARGFAGGMLFGTFILFGHVASGLHAKTSLPSPHVVLVIITMLAGTGLGGLGARLRVRRDARQAPGAGAPGAPVA